MSLFPVFSEEAERGVQQSLPFAKEYNFDVAAGRLKGGFVYGVDAVKIWAYKALMTPRYRHSIYTLDYGSELDSLIGKGYDSAYVLSEVKRYVEDCLTGVRHVSGVRNISVEYDGSKLTVSFTLLTEFGEGDMSVQI